MLTPKIFVGGLLVVSLVSTGMAQFDFGFGGDDGDNGDGDDEDDDGGGGGGAGGGAGGGGGFSAVVQQGTAVLSGFSMAFSPQLVQSLARFYLTLNGVLDGTETQNVPSLMVKPGSQSVAIQINQQRRPQLTNNFRSPTVSLTQNGKFSQNIINSAYVTQLPPSFPQMTVAPGFLQQHGQQLLQSLYNSPPSLRPRTVPPVINFPGTNSYPVEKPPPPMTTNLKIPTILLSPPVEQVTPENANFIGSYYPSPTGSSLSQAYFLLPSELSTETPFPQFGTGIRKDIPNSGLVGISTPSTTTTLSNSEELVEEEEEETENEIESLTSTSTKAPQKTTQTHSPLQIPTLPSFSQRLMERMKNSSGPAFWMNRFYPFGIGNTNITFTTMRPRRRRRKPTTAETTTTTTSTTLSPDEYYEEYEEEEEENVQGSSTMKSRKKKRKKDGIKIDLKNHQTIT